MTKEEHIAYWVENAIQDEDAMEYLFNGKRYVQSLFFAHLMLEKLLKAHWVKDNEGNYPPKIHNLNSIHAQTNLSLTTEQLTFCADMNKFQMEGRYPDYVSNIYQIVTADYALNYIQQCKALKTYLLTALS